MSDNTFSLEYFQNPENESGARNLILTWEFKSMPSYTLWRSEDIIQVSLEERIEWFQSHVSHTHPKIKETATYWYNYLKSLQETNKTPTNSPNLQFCSKRFSNELYCDI